MTSASGPFTDKKQAQFFQQTIRMNTVVNKLIHGTRVAFTVQHLSQHTVFSDPIAAGVQWLQTVMSDRHTSTVIDAISASTASAGRGDAPLAIQKAGTPCLFALLVSGQTGCVQLLVSAFFSMANRNSQLGFHIALQ